MPLTRITSNVITDGTIVDADISSSAAIAPSKLGAGGLPAGLTVLATGTTTARSLNDRFADILNIEDFGAIPDCKTRTGNISNGGNTITLTGSGANFTSADVGKSIAIVPTFASTSLNWYIALDPTSSGTRLATIAGTITAFVNSTNVTISVNANHAITGGRVVWGTDSAPALRSAAAIGFVSGQAIYVPGGEYFLATTYTNARTIPTGSSDILRLEGPQDSVTWRKFTLIGDNAVFTTVLYPQQQDNYNELVYIKPIGQIDPFYVEGITFNCYQPINTASGWGVIGAGGRVYGIYNQQWAIGYANRNVTITNCSFIDNTIGVRADTGDNFTISHCKFLYRYGYWSVGSSDWTVGAGIRQVSNFNFINNYFNGRSEPNWGPLESLTGTIGEMRSCADGIILSGNVRDGHIISGNQCVNHAREGIYIIQNNTTLENQSSLDSAIISNNILDGRYPAGQKISRNWGIRCDAPNTIISNNRFIEECTAILVQALDGTAGASWNTTVSDNSILMAPVTNPGLDGAASGIGILTPVNSCSDNMIVGYNIGQKFSKNGWDGSLPVRANPTRTIQSIAVTNGIATITFTAPHNFSVNDTVNFVGMPAFCDNVGSIVISATSTTITIRAFENNIATTTVSGATATWASFDFSVGISLIGSYSAYDDKYPFYFNRTPLIQNNNLRCYTIASGGFTTAFFIDSGDSSFLIKNNQALGFSFISDRTGGGILWNVCENNVFDPILRTTSSRYASTSSEGNYDQWMYRSNYFILKPLQVGWYQINIAGSRGASQFSGTFYANGELGYANPTFTANAGTANNSLFTATSASQVCDFKYTVFAGSTNSTEQNGEGGSETLTITSAHSSKNNTSQAITKISALYANGSVYLACYINKVLEKVPLSFSGGGGSGAKGWATVSNGIITSATVTVAGTGYTSSPTVKVADKHQRVIINNTDAIFNASITSGGVSSVAVTNGGSGYCQPISFDLNANVNLRNFGASIYSIQYINSDPNFPLTLNVTNGTKSVTATSGDTAFWALTKTGTGPIIIGSVVPTTLVPEYIGQEYLDISAVPDKFYKAFGTSAGDWLALN